MASTIKELHDNLKLFTRSLNTVQNKIADSGNIYFSQCTVTSVSEDRTHCDLLVLDKLEALTNVISTIPCNELNSQGHLTCGDTVLIGYNFGLQNPFIIKKIETLSYVENQNIKLSNRIDFSTLTV